VHQDGYIKIHLHRLGTSDTSNRFRRRIGPNQEKSDIFKPSRFEHLYHPSFGFWLFAWSRCGRIGVPLAISHNYADLCLVSLRVFMDSLDYLFLYAHTKILFLGEGPLRLGLKTKTFFEEGPGLGLEKKNSRRTQARPEITKQICSRWTQARPEKQFFFFGEGPGLGLSVWTLADGEWRPAAPGLKPLRLPRAHKKQRKRFLVPRLLSFTYVRSSIMSSAAVGIVPKSAQTKISTQALYILVERTRSQNIGVLLFL